MRVGIGRRTLPRRRWFLSAAIVAVTTFAPAGAVAQTAPAPTLSISGQADWIQPFHINVYVTVAGTGGPGGFVNVNVEQPQPPFGSAGGAGGTPLTCDGKRRTYAVQVNGFGGSGFQLGEAEASAVASCPGSAFAFEVKSIRITKP
jgi:hypothetical protein